MTYNVEGRWTTNLSKEFETLEEAVAECERLVGEHRDAMFSISGPGVGVNVYPQTERVPA